MHVETVRWCWMDVDCNLCCGQSPLLTIYGKWSSARSFAKKEIVLGGKNRD